jgi:hypothetical protein
MTNVAARSSSSIGSKETTQVGGPSPAHIASASGSWSGRHSAGPPAVEPDSAWAAPGERPLPSVAAPIATAIPFPVCRCRRRRRLRRLCHPPSHVAAIGTSAAAPRAAQPAPGASPRARGRQPGVTSQTERRSGAPTTREPGEGTFRRCLQSRARCRNPIQRRQRGGNRQVATLWAVERQLKHFP